MSLEDSEKKKNYSNVAPLSTEKGKIHYRKLKIKKALQPIKKVVTSVVNYIKEDLKNAKPVKLYQPRYKDNEKKKDWQDIH